MPAPSDQVTYDDLRSHFSITQDKMVIDALEMSQNFKVQVAGSSSPGFLSNMAWASVQMLFGDMDLEECFEKARLWRTVSEDIDLKIIAISLNGLTWRKGLPSLVDDGFVVEPVGSIADLVAEGTSLKGPDGHAGLEHLSHTGWSLCQEGRTRIVAVRRGSRTVMLATIAIPRDRNEDFVSRDTDFGGYWNQTCDARAEAALRRYVAAMNTKTKPGGKRAITVDWEAFAAGKELPYHTATAGYDFEADGNWEKARDAWAAFMPEEMRTVDRAAFLKAAIYAHNVANRRMARKRAA